jgi:serine/threonine protein kinase
MVHSPPVGPTGAPPLSVDPVQFGRYRLLNLLGEGGMAKVYRALLAGPMGFEKEVAVKRLDPKMTSDERVVKALINEARLGGQLRHKNIVEIYEFNEVNGNWYMAMEYVKGWTLEEVLRGCRLRREFLPGTVIVDLVVQMCRGLEYAHEMLSKDGQPMNLVHRDMKPANVIVNTDGDVKLMDFGIAKADTNLYKTTEADVTKGTPVYMSPEQVTGEDLDRRSDLFSMGSMLHELITLDVPFQGENLLALMHAVLHADLDKPSAQIEERLPQLAPIFRRCCARSPADRFSSASELSKAIRALRHELPAGPDLDEYLADLLREMPAATRTGEFGPDGAPAPQFPAGTQSLNTVSTAQDDVPAAAGSLFDDFDSIDVQAETAEAPSTDSGRRTGSSKPSAPSVPRKAPGATRAQKSLSRTSAVKKRKTLARVQRRKAVKRRQRMLWTGVILLLIGVSSVVGTLYYRSLQGPTIAADPTPIAAVSPAPTPDLAPLTDPEPVATPAVETTPKPRATPKPRGTPKPRATPKASSTPKATATPNPTPPPPTATPVPAVAAAGPGWVDFNSKPWSNVIVDGKAIKNTPVLQHPLEAGTHTVIFDCSSCDPPAREERTFTVEAGVRSKQIVRFGGK